MDAFVHLVLDVGTIAATIVGFLVLIIMVIAVMDGPTSQRHEGRKAQHTDHVEIRNYKDGQSAKHT